MSARFDGRGARLWRAFSAALALASVAPPARAQAQGEPGARTALRAREALEGRRAVEAARRALSSALEASEEARIGRQRLGSLSLRCARPCEAPESALLEATGLLVGQEVEIEALRVAVERLIKTGLVAQVSTDLASIEGALRVSFLVEPVSRIGRVRFEGLSPPPFRSELERVLSYRRGRPFPGLSAGAERAAWALEGDALRATEGELGSDADGIEAQLRSFRKALRREGFPDASVRLRAERDARGLVELTFLIEKGSARRLCEIGIRGLTHYDYSRGRALLLEDRPLYARALRLVDPIYTQRSLRRGQEALAEALRQDGFLTARVASGRVAPMDEPGCVRALVDVEQGPRWEVEFEGNRALSERELAEAFDRDRLVAVDQTSLGEAALRLERAYGAKGYPFARASCAERRRERLERSIVCAIEEGERLEIRSVSLVASGGGVRSAAEEPGLGEQELLAELNTKPYSLFESGGFLQFEALQDDARAIEEAYRTRGYRFATVEGFTLRIVEGDGLAVAIRIEEGPLVLARRVHLDQSAPAAGAALDLLERGDPFSAERARLDASRLAQRLSGAGWPMAHIEARCSVGAEQAGECADFRHAPACLVGDASRYRRGACARVPQADGRAIVSCKRLSLEPACAVPDEAMAAEIDYRIELGPRAEVGPVFVVGNLTTDDDLIRGELGLRPGDRLESDALLEGQARIRQLNVFTSVAVEAVGLDERALSGERATAALVVSVEEAERRFFDYSVALQGRDITDPVRRRLLAVGEVAYNDINVFGRALRIQPRAIAALDTLQLDDLGARGGADEAVGRIDPLLGLELAYADPRFGRDWLGAERLRLSVTPFYLLDLLGVTNNFLLREEWGLRLQTRLDVFDLVDRFAITFGLEGKSVTTRAPESGAVSAQGGRLFAPRRTIGKLYVDLIYDRRDSPLNPSRGFLLQLSPQLISGDAFGTGRIVRDAFARLSAAASIFVPIGGRIVWGNSARYGQILPLFGRARPAPQDERFVLGGVASLRGVAEAGVIARAATWRDVLRGGEFVGGVTSELRYPIAERYALYGASYLDAGVLVDCFDDERPSQATPCLRDAFPADDPLDKIRISAGIGLRYLLFEQLPLVLDYAALLDRRPGEPIGYLHFNIGYTF